MKYYFFILTILVTQFYSAISLRRVNISNKVIPIKPLKINEPSLKINSDKPKINVTNKPSLSLASGVFVVRFFNGNAFAAVIIKITFGTNNTLTKENKNGVIANGTFIETGNIVKASYTYSKDILIRYTLQGSFTNRGKYDLLFNGQI